MKQFLYGGNRFDRTSIPPEISDTGGWPTADDSALDRRSRKNFHARSEAMRLFVEHETLSLRSIQAQTGVARTSLYRLFQRCVQPHEDGRIQGFRALLPYSHLRDYIRTAPITTAANRQNSSGAFTQLLKRHPSLESWLQRQLRKRGQQIRRFDEVRPSARRIHKLFIDECRKLAIGPDQYPFNRERLGIRALATYAKRFANRSFEAAAAEAGAEHIGRAWPGRSTSVSAPVTYPYQEFEFDGHSIHARLTLRLIDPHGFELLYEIERLWILALKDTCTRVIPGYVLALGANYSGNDVLDAVRAALLPHKRRDLKIPGVTYGTCGGFPSQVIPECAFACWDVFRCDNAAAHLSENTIVRLIDFIGCRPEFGAPRTPDSRPFIESFFKLITEHFAHRFPGTTGSNPDDARRRLGDPEGDLRLLITLDELEELIDVVISDYNGTPHDGLGGRTPLEALQFHVSRSPSVIRQLARARRNQLHLLQECLLKPVRGSVDKGDRPHINFKGVKYSNDALSRNPTLIGRKLRIYFDCKDIRQLRAYFENGEELGVLTASRPWCYTPHSIKVRQEIFRLRELGKLNYREGEDPFEAYAKYKRRRAGSSRRAATDLARMRPVAQRAKSSLSTERSPPGSKPAHGVTLPVSPVAPKVKDLLIKKVVTF